MCKYEEDMECSNEKYKFYNNRIDSFKTWPSSDKINPKLLADAGLYYSGFNDQYICVWCGVKINKWQHNDIPFNEHKKFQIKKCVYLMMVTLCN